MWGIPKQVQSMKAPLWTGLDPDIEAWIQDLRGRLAPGRGSRSFESCWLRCEAFMDRTCFGTSQGYSLGVPDHV